MRRRGLSLADCEASLQSMLNPAHLYGIDAAVALLVESLESKDTIALAGDYDVDGASGVALGVEALRSFGAHKVETLLPDRFVGGYGLSEAMVEDAMHKGVTLLITVDNGIAAHQAISLAKEYGIRVIITDHHLPSDTLPPADAIINPNMPECTFASKNLAGVGVIFYLMCALRTALREQKWFIYNKLHEPSMSGLLDLVALGTVADMANIDNNNRLLIKNGIKRIRTGNSRKGIVALLEAMQVEPAHCNARSIGFALAPPLNAAGRLAHIDLAVSCLLASSWSQARSLAAELVALNLERKQIQNSMFQEAMEDAAQADSNSRVLVLFRPHWHQGLTGLVAGMVKDKCNKSCFVVTKSEDMLVGSARAVKGHHLLDWLTRAHGETPDTLSRFGGHEAAAGFTLYPHAFEDFLQAVHQSAPAPQTDEHEAGLGDCDGTLPTKAITLANALALEELTPWGKGCEEPIFHSEFTLLASQVMGVHHLRLQLADPLSPDRKLYNAVAFYRNEDEIPTHLPARVKIYYHLHTNRFRGATEVQLLVKDLIPLPEESATQSELTATNIQ